MTLTVERPPAEAPDAGVIEEARARQRRHRATAAAVALAGAAVAALVLGLGGGGGGGGSGSRHVAFPSGRAPTKSARLSPASCAAGRASQRPPSRSLLAILGVLRRPATPADALPQDARSNLIGTGFVRDVFVRYIRRTRTIGGSSYYIYPATFGECGTGETPHQGIMTRATNIDLGHGLIGGDGGGGAAADDIEKGRAVSTGPPGSATSTTITMIVPDWVANVTLHYPAGRASGYSPQISPPFTTTAPVVNNELIARVPRSGNLEAVSGFAMVWRSASGHVVRAFDRL